MCKTQQKLQHKFNSFTPIKGDTVSQAAQKNFYIFSHDDKAEVLLACLLSTMHQNFCKRSSDEEKS